VINPDDSTTIPKTLLKTRITALTPRRLREVEVALRCVLDLD
jgi:mRNA-degrading endonuclease toxin of MazEF toxin-antitoxin module